MTLLNVARLMVQRATLGLATATLRGLDRHWPPDPARPDTDRDRAALDRQEARNA